jgi:hypothetical protein
MGWYGRTFRFYKILEYSSVAAQLVASQEGLSFMESVMFTTDIILHSVTIKFTK